MAGIHPPFNVPEDEPGPRELPGPTRPDRISIWPVEEDRFGIDVLYHGATGFKRADWVHRSLEETGVAALLRQHEDRGWIVRFGPVGRDEMLTVLNGFVW